MSRLRGSFGLRGRWQGKVVVVHVHGDEVGRMRFRGAYVAAMSGWNEDRATGMSPLANEEPLVVVKAGVDIVWEVI